MKFKIFIFLSFLTCGLSAQIMQNIKGKVLDKESKIVLPGAYVFIPGSSPVVGTTTDSEGNFKLSVPIGRVSINVTYVGYEDASISELLILAGKEVELNIELRESVSQVDEVVIKAYKDKIQALNSMASTSVRQLSTEDASRYASGFADPSRMVSSFAGVGATEGDGVNDMVIRGNTPRGLMYRLEGIEIPNPNHFTDGQGATGGALSIISSDVLTNFDFYTGAFPAEYGNAFSGIMDMNLRKGNSGKREYALTASVVGMQATLEGPFKNDYEGSYLVNYRYSTFALLDKYNLIDLGDNNLSPKFQDLTVNFNLPTKKFGTFGVFAVGGKSTTGTVPVMEEINWADTDNWDPRKDEIENHSMGIAGIKHIYNFSNKKTYLKSVIASTYQSDDWNIGHMSDSLTRHLDYKDDYTYSSLRGHLMLNHKFNSKHTLRAGFIINQLFANMYQLDYDWDKKIYDLRIDKDVDTRLDEGYAQWKYRLTENFETNLGFHIMHMALNGSISIEPRIGVKWNLSKNQSLSAGIGIHTKAEAIPVYFALVRMPDGSMGEGNKNLNFTKSFHNVLGYDIAFNENLRLKIEAYYQYMYDVIIVDTVNSTLSTLNYSYGVPEIPLSNGGTGYNTGLEITLEKFFSNNYYFLITGSLFDSKYLANDGNWYNTAFNNNYISNFLFGKEFKIRQNTLGINAKILYRGGFRYTPLDIENSTKKNDEVLQQDKLFTERLPAFTRADLGLSFRRNNIGYSWILSLDIQNCINRKNIVGYEFDSDEKYPDMKRPMEGMGLIPILSYKIVF